MKKGAMALVSYEKNMIKMQPNVNLGMVTFTS